MSEFTNIRAHTLSQSILEVLREAVISGQLKPGENLVQSKLATQFGVSRAPLREALKQLEEEGLVKTIPFKSTAVAGLSPKDAEEIRSLRNVVEEFAAQLAIERLQPEHLDELDAIYRRMQDAAEREDLQTLDAADLELHTRICEFSGHSLLLEVWGRYVNRFRRVLALLNRVSPDMRLTVERHEPLLRALRDRDREALHAFYQHQLDALMASLPKEAETD